MSAYNLNGTEIYSAFNRYEEVLEQIYDINKNELFSSVVVGGLSGGGEENRNAAFTKTILPYATNWLIKEAWLTNATIQRDAIKALYEASNDAIPFFIQTDGHGRYCEGNVGCHNLAESTMRYIRNFQLGDYASYYRDGASAASHINVSQGIKNYISAMGNHEFLNNNDPDALTPDLSVLVPAFTPKGADINTDYGFYKVLDPYFNVKYLVGQPHIPDENDSDGFIVKYTSAQWEWFIDELEANDGYDIVVLNHEPFGGTYTRVADGSTVTKTGGAYNLTPILQARKAKTSGSYTDSASNVYQYDFTGCTSDLLCVFHGHTHKKEYIEKTQLGYPVYIQRDFTNNADCCYGLIDRANSKLYIYAFTKADVSEALVLDL